MDFVRKIFNRETVLYIVFGVLTTIINYVVFGLVTYLFGGAQALWANVIAFIAAVIFAFITNKLFVFESKCWQKSVIVKESLSFLSARLFSFGIEELGLWICMLLNIHNRSICGINGIMIAKAALAVIVVILNYFFSKLIIFKKKD